MQPIDDTEVSSHIPAPNKPCNLVVHNKEFGESFPEKKSKDLIKYFQERSEKLRR